MQNKSGVEDEESPDPKVKGRQRQTKCKHCSLYYLRNVLIADGYQETSAAGNLRTEQAAKVF